MFKRLLKGLAGGVATGAIATIAKTVEEINICIELDRKGLLHASPGIAALQAALLEHVQRLAILQQNALQDGISRLEIIGAASRGVSEARMALAEAMQQVMRTRGTYELSIRSAGIRHSVLIRPKHAEQVRNYVTSLPMAGFSDDPETSLPVV